jgi:hypothetical protein
MVVPYVIMIITSRFIYLDSSFLRVWSILVPFMSVIGLTLGIVAIKRNKRRRIAIVGIILNSLVLAYFVLAYAFVTLVFGGL